MEQKYILRCLDCVKVEVEISKEVAFWLQEHCNKFDVVESPAESRVMQRFGHRD